MMSDALLPFLDYRGWIFGINDATEREVGGDSFEMASMLSVIRAMLLSYGCLPGGMI